MPPLSPFSALHHQCGPEWQTPERHMLLDVDYEDDDGRDEIALTLCGKNLGTIHPYKFIYHDPDGIHHPGTHRNLPQAVEIAEAGRSKPMCRSCEKYIEWEANARLEYAFAQMEKLEAERRKNDGSEQGGLFEGGEEGQK